MPASIDFDLMRYNDANWNRGHRCIEVQEGFVADRAMSHVTPGLAMTFELPLGMGFLRM